MAAEGMQMLFRCDCHCVVDGLCLEGEASIASLLV